MDFKSEDMSLDPRLSQSFICDKQSHKGKGKLVQTMLQNPYCHPRFRY